MKNSYRFGFAIEQQLGHITFGQNLQHAVKQDPSVESSWLPIPLDQQDIWQSIPNLSLRLSLRSRDLTRKLLAKQPVDCLLFHTQLITLFSTDLMERIPCFISLDATPENFKEVASAYSVSLPQGKLDKLKQKWYRHIFAKSAGLIAWSEWVKASLQNNYGVADSKIYVIPPGINTDQWQFVNREKRSPDRLRLLFVGGDFERKGGNVLLKAFRKGLSEFCQLDIVTTDQCIQSESSIRVHRGLKPNSAEIKQLFVEADIFILPTLGDGQPWVVLEAMASGLPVISTQLGAIPELVQHGVTGFLIPLNDSEAIIHTVQLLFHDLVQRINMGIAGRNVVMEQFDATLNSSRLLDVMKMHTQLTRF